MTALAGRRLDRKRRWQARRIAALCPPMVEVGEVKGYAAGGAVKPRALLAPPVAVALFAVAASLALRLPTLGMLPPWGDEVITLNTVALDTLDVVAERMHRMHSPTFFWILQALGLDGSSLFLLRLPSAVADSLGAGLTALVAYRLGGWRAALLLALLYAAMPVMLEEAQDARPNSFFFGFLGLLLWSAARLIEHPRMATAAWRRQGRASARRLRWTWIAHVVATVGLINMLPLGLFAIVAIDGAVLWHCRRKARRFLLRPWALHRLVSIVLLAPLLYGYLRYVGRFAGDYWYSNSLAALWRTLRASAGAGITYDPNLFLGPLGNGILLVLFLLAVLLGVLWAKRRASLLLVLALAFGTQILLIAVSQHTSLYVVRYFGVSTPALTVLASLGLARLWQRQAPLALLAGPVLLGLLFLQALDVMHQLNKPRFDLAVERLRESGIERIAFYDRDDFQADSVLYHLRGTPKGTRLQPWPAFLAAYRGELLWIVEYTYRPVHPAWAFFASRSGLGSCAPSVRGLNLLAIGRHARDLEASCPPED